MIGYIIFSYFVMIGYLVNLKHTLLPIKLILFLFSPIVFPMVLGEALSKD